MSPRSGIERKCKWVGSRERTDREARSIRDQHGGRNSPATNLAWFPKSTLLATQKRVARDNKNQGKMIPSDSL